MKPHVLILEDNFIISLDIALAFLDIDVADGESYRVAQKLTERNIPFIFAPGKNRELLPDEFRQSPFVSKPVSSLNLVQLAKSLTSAFN